MASTADLSVLLDQLKDEAEARLLITRDVPELQGIKDTLTMPALQVAVLAEVAAAAAEVRTDIGLTVYEKTPISVWSGKRMEKRLGDALARLRSVLAGEEEKP